MTFFESEFLGNHYIILVLPGKWEFECYESWFKGSGWGEEYEYESYFGRKEYAKREAGGYYVARLGTLEILNKFNAEALQKRIDKEEAIDTKERTKVFFKWFWLSFGIVIGIYLFMVAAVLLYGWLKQG